MASVPIKIPPIEGAIRNPRALALTGPEYAERDWNIYIARKVEVGFVVYHSYVYVYVYVYVVYMLVGISSYIVLHPER